MRALIVSGLFIILCIIGEFIILLIISGLFIIPPKPPVVLVALPNPDEVGVVAEVGVLVGDRVTGGGVVSLKLLIRCTTSPLFTL